MKSYYTLYRVELVYVKYPLKDLVNNLDSLPLPFLAFLLGLELLSSPPSRETPSIYFTLLPFDFP